jgi:hypothetical protein
LWIELPGAVSNFWFEKDLGVPVASGRCVELCLCTPQERGTLMPSQSWMGHWKTSSERRVAALGLEKRSMGAPVFGLFALTLIASPSAAQPFRDYVSRFSPRGGGGLARGVDLDVERVVRNYLRGRAESFGVAANDVDGLELEHRHSSEHNGLSFLHFRQTVRGIEVFQARVSAAVAEDGSLMSVSTFLLPDADLRINTLVPEVRFEEAVRLTAAFAGVPGPSDGLAVIEDHGGPSRRREVSLPSLSDRPIPVELKLAPAGEALRLAWSVVVALPGGSDAFEELVDAVDGREILRQSHLAHSSPQYKVFPVQTRVAPLLPAVESPAHGSQTVRGDEPGRSTRSPRPLRAGGSTSPPPVWASSRRSGTTSTRVSSSAGRSTGPTEARRATSASRTSTSRF